jgi:ubiquinone/menaquinone biosynthesis C-methylase UbiE
MAKDFYNKVYQEDHPSNYSGTPDGKHATTAREGTNRWLDSTGLAHRPNARILEVGCGMAYFSDIHPGWEGVDYSKTAVARVKELQGAHTRIFEADAQSLPFEDGHYDGVFSWAALEHVPDPDKAFQEVDRILAGGGGTH